MPFAPHSLETLRQRVDLVEALSPYLHFKKAGGAYVALCPFHEERTPSFSVRKGDSHYHCYGCGAHGDAIAFFMQYQKMDFFDAVEVLAEKFHVPLEKVEGEVEKGPLKRELRAALDVACRFFHTLLVHTELGVEALAYLNKRGITLDFINRFEVGYAPVDPQPLCTILQAKQIDREYATAAGLLTMHYGKRRSFFADRIVFPIRAVSGQVIGFSGRKFKENTGGGKYINTPETPLFKKSKVLYGLYDSRARIAKERRALIVEGQIDALRLIYSGLDFTVAGQGTAFGEEQVKELVQLGITTAYLALDGDQAGREATVKVGDLFLRAGVDVQVVRLPKGKDPDTFLQEQGVEPFYKLLQQPQEYLAFVVDLCGQKLDLTQPAIKQQLADQLMQRIRAWQQPLLVHESLRRLAQILNIPETLLGIGQEELPTLFIKKIESAGAFQVDPDWIIEVDVLRWLVRVAGEEGKLLHQMAGRYLKETDFQKEICATLYVHYQKAQALQQSFDLFAAACQISSPLMQQLLADLMHKRISLEKAIEQFSYSLQRLLDRNWHARRSAILAKLRSGVCSEEQVSALTKEFDQCVRTHVGVV